MQIYNKLIRDNIPEIIKKDGKTPIIHIAKDEEYEKALAQKLHEEADEFIENPSIEEAADILEVIQSICELKNIDSVMLEDVRQKKQINAGALEKE